MAYEKKPGDVSIFPNRKKVEGDRTPDFKGEILTPDGELLEIALWVKPMQGGTFYAGKAQKPRQKDGLVPGAVPAKVYIDPPNGGPHGDGLPF